MSSQPPLDLAPEAMEDGVLVRLDRDIDLNTSPVLREALMGIAATETPSRLVIDLSGVSFMDSSGVATLVEILRAQQGAGGRLILAGLQPRVRGIFEISRLDTLFTIAADLDEARRC